MGCLKLTYWSEVEIPKKRDCLEKPTPFMGVWKNPEAEKTDVNLYYYGNRYYDPVVSIFLGVDRFAEKTSGLSGFHYCANNPISFIDVGGDSTYLVIYGASWLNTDLQRGHNDVGSGFKKSANALAASIKSREGYNPKRDNVVIVYAPSSEKFIEATNEEYESGAIAELNVFSHGTPTSVSLGGEDGNMDQRWDYELREINETTMDQIDVSNFENNARITLNGCNIAGYEEDEYYDSFAQSFANYLGGNRTVKAFAGYSEFPTNNGKINYNGRMIRTKDRSTQKTIHEILYPE